MPQLLAQSVVISVPLQPTGKRLYEEVWSIAHAILEKSSIYLDYDNQWWNKNNWKEILDNSKDFSSPSECKPFILKFVDRGGYNCSICNWTEKCSGCIVEPSESVPIYDFLTKCHLAIEWHSQMIETEFDACAN